MSYTSVAFTVAPLSKVTGAPMLRPEGVAKVPVPPLTND